MDTVFGWVAVHGYGAIFFLLLLGVVGIPIPDETLLVFCGYLIWRGTLRPVPAFFSALAGSWCGISVSYTIGRTLGAEAVHRFGKYLHITEQGSPRSTPGSSGSGIGLFSSVTSSPACAISLPLLPGCQAWNSLRSSSMRGRAARCGSPHSWSWGIIWAITGNKSRNWCTGIWVTLRWFSWCWRLWFC